MPRRTVVSLFESLVTRLEQSDASSRSSAARKQAALVRSLLDEVERRPLSDARVLVLADQIDEEVARLGRLLVESAGAIQARAS